jgi:hypothetical protein
MMMHLSWFRSWGGWSKRRRESSGLWLYVDGTGMAGGNYAMAWHIARREGGEGLRFAQEMSCGCRGFVCTLMSGHDWCLGASRKAILYTVFMSGYPSWKVMDKL